MYKILIYYRVPGSDELRYTTLFGVFLSKEVIEWISNYPNLEYILPVELKKKEEMK